MNGDESLNVVLAIDNAYLAGVNQERERIIKLLQDFIDSAEDFDGMAIYRMGVLDSIASIKGENK